MLWFLFICIYNLIKFNVNGNLTYWIILIIFYLITITGIVQYYKYKPFSAWWLSVSFILSSILIYIYDYNRYRPSYEYGHPNLLNWQEYIDTYFMIIFYTIPFIVVSIIIAVISKEKK